eukprot:9232051-Heterocapsa_arctica.AAC.1
MELPRVSDELVATGALGGRKVAPQMAGVFPAFHETRLTSGAVGTRGDQLLMTKRGSDKGVVGAARVQGTSRGISFAAPWMRPARRRSQRQ